MNNLANLTQKLKLKPQVTKEEDIEVAIIPEQPLPKTEKEGEQVRIPPNVSATVVIAEKDDGTAALDILKRLERQKITKVAKKEPEEREVVTKAPIIEEELLRAKPKKQKMKGIIAQETEKMEDVVEGGPQMTEPGVKPDELINAPAKPAKRYTKRVVTNVINLGPANMIQIGDTPIGQRIPPPPVIDIRASSYYMNNREIFVNFIDNLFEPYKEDLMDETQNISCDNIGKDTGKVGLLTHQKIVRDYINLYTPYRGLLLFHGLGSGKTCSSIAIAEGLKSYRQIIVMTPASLRRNYMEEIKKCGDLLFRKNQFWEWISVEGKQELIEPLAEVLGNIKINYDNEIHSKWVNYIKRHKGVWLVNVTKPTNYDELSTPDKKSLNDQLDEMIQLKYRFINYNGLRRSRFKQMTLDFTVNIFDNSVVIIDEAHNLISRIVNKIGRFHKFSERKRGPGTVLPIPLALQLYEFLLQAENCRVVMLTGTPVINYPNEIAVLYNILRGYIKTWKFTLNTEKMKGSKLNIETIRKEFASEKILDYIDLSSSKELTITRNPFGFENKIKELEGYKGVYNRYETVDQDGRIVLDERGVMSDEDFISRVIKLLKKKLDIEVSPRNVTFSVNTALPDTLETFVSAFIDQNDNNGKLINEVKFKRRIMGLTSYFKSAQEELLPAYNRDINRHIVRIPMSDYQFQIYEAARHDERETEGKGKSGAAKVDVEGLFEKPKATYKIFSRLFCNFVMPDPPGRPTPALLRLQKGMKWLNQYLKDSNDKRVKAVQENIKTYIASLPPDYESNKEIADQVILNVEKYVDRFIVKQYDVVDFETYLSKKYQDRMIEIAQEKEARRIEEANRPTKAQEKEAKALAKAAKEAKAAEKALEKQLKAEEKLVKELAKAQEKEAKELAKAQEKEAKELAKAREKEAKELAKAQEKEAKELAKAQEKAEKERLKAEKKKAKGLDDDDSSDSNSDSNSDSDSDSDSESDYETDRKGKGKKLNDDDDDEYINELDIPSYLLENDGGAKGKKVEFVEEAKEVAEVVPRLEVGQDALDDELEKMYESEDENDDKSIQLEGYKDEDALDRTFEELEGDEVLEKMDKNSEYKRAIAEALDFLKRYKQKYLSLEALRKYSPKFLTMIENIEDPEHAGLHLVYSQFRSMEGIGIFALALEANGYAQFKIVRTSVGWDLVTSDEDMGKPHYALYTGTEDAEEREIIRNIYNGDWAYIPNNIAAKLRTISSNNNMGEIIKVLMITSAGSEGINLRNTRYVHIMEPYWHPVRLEQVIGRARRICSHQALPLELRTVDVFIYLMTLTQEQIDSEFGIELKLKDRSNIPPFLWQTSDEKLFEISTIKENLTDQILRAIKSSSIDCITHTKSNMKEGIVCLSFGDPPNTKFSYNPDLSQDQNDTIADINMEVNNWQVKEVFIKSTGKKYMLRLDNNELYDYDSIIQAKRIPGIRPILLGKLARNEEGEYQIIKRKI
jgi:hypothetical protein